MNYTEAESAKEIYTSLTYGPPYHYVQRPNWMIRPWCIFDHAPPYSGIMFLGKVASSNHLNRGLQLLIQLFIT